MDKSDKIQNKPEIGVIILAYIAFIALGMPDGLLGVAWPSIRTDFSLPLDAAGILITVSTTGYLISSFLSGLLISRMSIGVLLAGSCAITCAGLIGYTIVPAWWMVVLLGFICGLGAGAIDAGLNTYGASYFHEGLMQWLHASYGIGVTLGPLIMTFALTTLNSWQTGYRIVGGFQLLLAVCFALTLPLWIQKEAACSGNKSKPLTKYKTPFSETLCQTRVWLSLLLFFLYTGSEISLGTWVYTLLVESRGVSPDAAGLSAGSFWAAFTIGRFAAGLYAKRAGVNLMVFFSLLVAFAGTLLLWANLACTINLVAVALIGLAIAPIFPALLSGTGRRVGVRFVANTIGMQIAAGGLGTAVIPGLMGVLGRRISLEVIPLCLAILFAMLFGLYMLANKFEVKT